MPQRFDLSRVRGDILVNSLTGGANQMNNHIKDLAESRKGAPPLSRSRR